MLKTENIRKITSNTVVFLDLETTGTNVGTDRIVQIACIKLHPDGTMEEKCRKINPGIPIPPEASEVHKIYDQDVVTEPKFKFLAKGFYEFIEGCDIAGYNSNRFDIPLLVKEFERAGIEFKFDASKNKIIDLYKIFCEYNKRDLSTCYKRYTGKDMEGAHDAGADSSAVIEIFENMLDEHQDIPTVDKFFKIETVDLSGYLALDKEGDVCFNFGKNKGKKIKNDRSYCEWICNNDFPLQTKNIIIDTLKVV